MYFNVPFYSANIDSAIMSDTNYKADYGTVFSSFLHSFVDQVNERKSAVDWQLVWRLFYYYPKLGVGMRCSLIKCQIVVETFIFNVFVCVFFVKIFSQFTQFTDVDGEGFVGNWDESVPSKSTLTSPIKSTKGQRKAITNKNQRKEDQQRRPNQKSFV